MSMLGQLPYQGTPGSNWQTVELQGIKVSGSVQGNFHCHWSIERFSSLDSQVGKYYQTQTFQLEKGGISWFLLLCPGGETEDSKGYVSVFVCKQDETQRVNTKFNITLRNTKGTILLVSEHKWMSFNDRRNGYPKAIESENVKSKLVDDALVVILDATYCMTCVGNGASMHHYPEISPMVKMIDDFGKLWVSKEHTTDFTITVGGEDIHVHSIVLAARSEVFAAMFKHDTKDEKDTRRVEITDHEKDTIHSFIEFIYFGCVCAMGYDLALELLRASDKYEVSDLKLYCCNYLMSIINDGNVCKVLVSADIYNCQELRGQAMKHLFESKTVAFSEVQRSIFKTRPELLCDIVEQMIKK